MPSGELDESRGLTHVMSYHGSHSHMISFQGLLRVPCIRRDQLEVAFLINLFAFAGV